MSFRVASRAAAQAYLDRLMCGVLATSPRGRTIWEGFVQEASVEIDGQTTTASLVDMANQIVVRYKDEAGTQVSGTPVVDAASIARYGTKTRLINFATTTAAAATNRAAVILKQIGSPRSKQKRSAGSGRASTGYKVTLTCRGWWDTLAWLLTSSASTSTAVTSTQAMSQIAAYNATNPFFSLDTTNIVATGVSDTETIEADSTYQDAIATKLASGDSAQQRVVYGCYENRRITIRPWAYASPTSASYVQRAGDPTIRDAYGSIVPIWDVRPDAIVLLPDLTLPASTSTALDRADRMYVRRVRVKLSRSDESIELEPDDADSIEELLTRPNGNGVSGTSARQAAIERTIVSQAQTRFSGVNGKVDLGGGSITTGGGSIDLTSGGGEITLPGGGGTITLPPPSGGGSTSIPGGSGTTGSLVKWTGSSSLGDAVAGTDYSAPGHTHAAGDIVSGTLAPARLGGGTPSATTFLAGDSSWKTIAAVDVGAAPITAQYWVSTADSALSAEINLGALSNGLLKQTVSAGVATPAIAVAGTDYSAPGHTHTSTDITNWNEAVDDRVAALLVAGSNITLTYNDAGNTLTIASSASGTVAGTGTAGRIMQWASGGANAENSTLIKTGTGVLTLATGTNTMTLTIGASGGTLNLAGGVLTLGPDLTTSGAGATITLSAAGAYTLTIPATGTAVLGGTGTAKRVPFYSNTTTLTTDANLTYDSAANVMVISGGLAVGPSVGSGSGSANGEIIVGGSGAALSFVERGGSNTWTWYSLSGKARLFDGTTDRLIVATGGNTGIKVTPTHTLHLGDDDAAKTTTTTWTTTSDARTKEILGDYMHGLAFLRSLPPVRIYRRNGRFGTQAGEIAAGFVAQELETIAPSWVVRRPYEEADGSTVDVLRVNQHELSYVLLRAVLELAERIERHGY